LRHEKPLSIGSRRNGSGLDSDSLTESFIATWRSVDKRPTRGASVMSSRRQPIRLRTWTKGATIQVDSHRARSASVKWWEVVWS
jgi:hypothetical protein